MKKLLTLVLLLTVIVPALVLSQDREKILSQYREVPDASYILKEYSTNPLYDELVKRYTANLLALNKEVSATGAKMIVAILTPEIGISTTNSTKLGIPIILELCRKNGIDVYNLASVMQKYKPEEITQMPLDGHWSKRGAQIIADEFAGFLTKYPQVKSTVTYKSNQRPKTMGDLDKSSNQILDGNKDLPYNLVTNAQGFRMNYDLQFPKTKQRILFMGDSQLYSPFLDNPDIATAVVQKKLGDREIINAGVVGYTLDDYLSLFQEKAKYAEPDIVVIVTNPNDIIDFFFSQRNKMNRSHKGYAPTQMEIDYYNKYFKK